MIVAEANEVVTAYDVYFPGVSGKRTERSQGFRSCASSAMGSKQERGKETVYFSGKRAILVALASRNGDVLIRLREAGGREAAKARTIVWRKMRKYHILDKIISNRDHRLVCGDDCSLS